MKLTPGERIVIGTVAMLAAFVIFGLLLVGSLGAEAATKTLDLGIKTPEYVRATCAKVRGVFVDNEGKMSCVFPRGVVRCTEDRHCYGYPKHPRPEAPLRVQPGPPPEYSHYPEWQWHNDRW